MGRLGLGSTQDAGRSGKPERRSQRIALRIRVLPLAIVLAALVACLSSAPAAFATTCNKFAASGVPSGIEGKNTNSGTEAAPYKTLEKLEESLTAGQTGCLESGQTFDTKENTDLERGNGTEASPTVITSTESAKPATITNSLVVEASYISFSHLIFKWKMPEPWVCWNAEGNPVENEKGEALACNGEHVNKEDGPQVLIDAKHDSLLSDEITSEDTNTCLNISSSAEHTLVENDNIYGCGPEYKGTKSLPEETAWYEQGVYDSGIDTELKNNYIYGSSRDGILWYGGGKSSVAEHNIIDGNGNGIMFGNHKGSRAEWNIITNNSLDDHGNCAEPEPHYFGCFDFATAIGESESGGTFEHNCTYNNLSGEIEEYISEPAKMTGVTVGGNKLKTNPLYKNATKHEYGLSKSSPCLGYGPSTAQPTPTATSEAASSVKNKEATLNGTVNPESLETKYYFEYGKTISYGTKTVEASAGSGTSDVKESKVIAILEPGTTYHYRLVAINASGTSDGEDKTFTTGKEVAGPTCQQYASSEGSDSTGTGTKEKPYKTVHKLIISLKAGEVGCLAAGQTFIGQETGKRLTINSGEVKGTSGSPITISSTNVEAPAILEGGVTVEKGANYINFEHLKLNLSSPQPWICWTKAGDPWTAHNGEVDEGEKPGHEHVYENPYPGMGKCSTGTASSENGDTAIGGEHISWLYDDINGGHSAVICLVVGGGAKATIIEHDRIHGCGPVVEPKSVFAGLNEQAGWHMHAVYAYGVETIVKNNYIYEDSRNGVLLYPAAEKSTVSHNILDGNGAGASLEAVSGSEGRVVKYEAKNKVEYNVITNSTSPRGVTNGAEAGLDFGIDYKSGKHDAIEDNDFYSSLTSGEGPGAPGVNGGKALTSEAEEGTTISSNKELNPEYTSTSKHEYAIGNKTLEGYGPESPPTGEYSE